MSYVTNYSYHSSGNGKGQLKRITYPTSTSGGLARDSRNGDSRVLLLSALERSSLPEARKALTERTQSSKKKFR
ncbi:MAG: hypothetical protein ACREQZ_01445, partial [Woeseiaceae bacterium]